jgi:hypothetical protein
MMLTPNEDFSLRRINIWDLIRYFIVSDTWEVKFEVSDERNQGFTVRVDRAVLVPFLLG